MMVQSFRRAINDIFKNRFLNFVSIITIALSTLIASAFILFFINTVEIVNVWKTGIRIMAYLTPGLSAAELFDIKLQIQHQPGVQEVQFISKEDALNSLKEQMARQSALFENLSENPLPDAFEIRIAVPDNKWEAIESFASEIESLKEVEEVEYGQQWLGRFMHVVNLFRFAGYTLCMIVFLATVFIVANTIRLVIYSRSEEVEIMRLVGATDAFIKIPFFIQGIIQGAVGATIGLTALFIAFSLVTASVEQDIFSGSVRLRFLPPAILMALIASSMLVGWIGCYLSLKQYLKI